MAAEGPKARSERCCATGAGSAQQGLTDQLLQTVLVTGAGGKTGKLTLQKLLAQSQLFQTRAFVHTQQAGRPWSSYITALALLRWSVRPL